MVDNWKRKTKEKHDYVVDCFSSFTEKFREKEKKYLWVMGIIYKLFLDVYYVSVISKYWAIDGLTCSVSEINYILSWVLYIVGYCTIMGVKNDIVLIFLHMQWILTIAPTIVICGVQDNRSMIYMIYILLVVVVQRLVGGKERKSVPISFGNERLEMYVTIFLCIIVAAVWGIMAVWNEFAGVKAFDLVYIYEMRSKLVYPPLFGYIVSWVTRAIIPWLLIVGLHRKKVFLILYSLFFEIIFYMILGHKSLILLVGVIVIVYTFSKINVLLIGTYFGMLCSLLIGTVFGWTDSKLMILFNGLLGERTLFIPALIRHQFYDFFSKYPKVYFSDGMLGRFFSQTNLYKNSLGYMVYAYNNQGNLEVEANSGYLADSYAQMGIVGMLIIGIMVILVVKFFSSYSSYVPKSILCCITVQFCVLLNDGAFFTILLTGGTWIIIVLLTIYTRRTRNND